MNKSIAKQKTSEREVDYQQLFELAPFGYLVIEKQEKISVANRIAAKMLRVDSPRLLKGRFFADFLHPADLNAWTEHRNYLLKHQKRHSTDLFLKCADGEMISVRIECIPQWNEPQSCGQCLMAIVDTSDQVQALRASEEKYRHLVEHTHDVPCKLNHCGVFLYIGPQVAKYGFDPEKVLGSNFIEYIHEEDKAMVAADFQRIVDENVSIASEFRVNTQHGDVVWFEHRSVLFIDGPNGIPEFNLILRDITERKRVEAARKWTDQQRRIALDAAHLGWWHIDPQTETSTYDHRYREIFGLLQQDNQQEGFFQRVHADDRGAVVAKMRTALNPSNPQPYDTSFRILRPDGEIRWVQAYGLAVFEKNGTESRATGFVGTVADITEQRQMRDALEKRVLFLTQPLGNNEEISFEDLVDLVQIQRIQDEFSAATGVASIITRPDGTPITEPSNYSEFCGEIICQTEEGKNNCQCTATSFENTDPNNVEIRNCRSAGLWCAGASIAIGGRKIATWLIGQVRDETQTEKQIRAYAREIGIDEDTAVEAFYRVPEMNYKQFKNVAKAMHSMANQISTSAYQNILQARFITAQEKAKNDLRESERRYRGLFKTVSDAIFVFDGADLTFVDVNDAALKLYGYTRDELFQISQDQLEADMTTSYGDFCIEAETQNGGISDQFHQKKDGTVFPVEISRCTFSLNGCSLVCEVIRDISERVARDKEIQNSREELRRLASEIPLAEQHERQRVASALHDGVGQLLSSAYLRTDALCQRNTLPKDAQTTLMSVAHILQDSMKETRSLTFNLSCPALNEFGLAAALEELCNTLSSDHGIDFSFYGELIRVNLMMDHKIVLYRTVRELLMNVIRHSCAHQTWVRMAYSNNALLIEVEDNGTGFDNSNAGRGFSPSGGYGLFSVRESIRHINGTMTVESEENKGTLVRISVPIAWATNMPNSNET